MGNNHSYKKESFIQSHKDRWMKEKNPKWKGGTYKTTRGYILEKCSTHPFCDKKGYVKQDRLVIEKSIKRFLKPNEIVHHINGIKDDNRFENLKLFNNQTEHNKIHKKKRDKKGRFYKIK